MEYLTFLLAILHAYKAVCQEILWDTTVQLAENLTLECVYPSADTLTQMEWFKVNATDREPIAIFNPVHGVVIRKPYADRVFFLNSSLTVHDMTLSFHNASEADAGFYSCSLHTFPYGPWQKVIQVVSSGSFDIAVLSYRHIVSDSGKNVTLTCELPREWRVEVVQWEKIQPHQIDLLSSCNLSQGRSYTSKHRRQIESSCSLNMRSSFLVIPHVSITDSGLYRCSFKASTGENKTCVMDLTISHGKADNQYILFLTGGTVLLLLFVILITTAILISYNRRRRRKRFLFEESWDTKTKAPNNSRNPTSTNECPDGAREDIYVNYPTIPRRPKTKV
ncbi:CD226 antigen isoform X2 [Erinaceus europaeus]|uniref:CD226 antigen isoform X2 n=1 Tax=Erinaceus europaeus TaxID=9365 RepID=A0ABM3W0A6_ERIEU|nr:CD226 antigen isoform X2 [Erinaceus europaeus]XP_060030012.1 CD226 antigen isoform X2 [Erinaceus europaeus]